MAGKAVISARAMDSNFRSSPQNIGGSKGYSVQCVFTGTTVDGTLSLESSTNYSTGLAETWDPIPGASYSPTEAGSITFNLYNQYYPFFRFKWVDSGSSSDSLISVTSNTKD